MRIALESPDQPDIVALIEALDAYQKPLYPAESHHGIDLQALAQPHVLFAVARTPEGRAVGCGAIVLAPEYGELKRMYTDPAHRGAGVAGRLLSLLEQEALGRGCREFKLETGYLQPEALGFYAARGYARCGPFGDYTDDPNSVFMQKSVPAPLPQHTCPLCGGPNDCAPAGCGSFDTACWCSEIRFSAELLARVPAAQQGMACICRQCAQAAAEEASAGAPARGEAA